MSRTNLFDLDLEGLEGFFAELGEKSFRARQLMQWIHQYRVVDFAEMSNFSKGLRQTLSDKAELTLPEVLHEHVSKDGTRKWIIRLSCGNSIETVFIPEDGRGTLCVSSQVGCALECTFCSTAQQGFNRNLSASEIIGQLWIANEYLGKEPKGNRMVTNVVMMGMGEPLANYKSAVSAMKLMRDDLAYGISWRRVTLSTSGMVPMIDKLREDCHVSLAISLLIDTFNPDRWDYIYTYQPGNGDREQRRITVFFKDEKLNRLDGNTRVVAREELPEVVRTDKNVVVPLTKRNTGLIDDIKDTLGMADETEAIVEEDVELPEPAEVPIPKQNTGLLDKVKDTLSSDDEPEEIYSEDTDEESEGPGLIDRIKSGIGLGDEEVE